MIEYNLLVKSVCSNWRLVLSTAAIVMIVILVILIIALVALTILGKRAQKRQEEQQAQMEAVKQSISMLIIDKKRMRINEAGLPAAVMENTPKLLRRSKLPILKVKVGPQIMNLVCDEKIFDSVPVKKEVKAEVSGIYVISVRGIRGGNAAPEEKKKGFWKDLVAKAQEKAGAKPIK
jgi:type II secretory pathway pseudopilin PulG